MNKGNDTSFDQIRIRQIRESKGLTQGWVAECMDMWQSSYNAIEQGKTKLRAETLHQLAQCLDVDIRCFFDHSLPYDRQLSLAEELRSCMQQLGQLEEKTRSLEQKLLDEQTLHKALREGNEILLAIEKKKNKKLDFYLALALFVIFLVMLLQLHTNGYFDVIRQ